MRKSIHLEYLKKGDLVAIVSTAKYITKKDCQFAIKYIKKEGLSIVNLDKTTWVVILTFIIDILIISK